METPRAFAPGERTVFRHCATKLELALMDTLRHHVLIPREKAITAFLTVGKKSGWVRHAVTAWQVLTYLTGMDVKVRTEPAQARKPP